MTVDWWVVEWALVFVALFGAVLVVIRILEGKPRNNVREAEHRCWPDCSSSQHYTGPIGAGGFTLEKYER